MTLKTATAHLASIGIALTKRDDEYRVTVKGAKTAADRKYAEAIAYYTGRGKWSTANIL